MSYDVNLYKVPTELKNEYIDDSVLYSMMQLGRLALNLWTSYDDFNLMECLKSLDEDNMHVARCAIDVRMGLL